jgi:hypothetical protein
VPGDRARKRRLPCGTEVPCPRPLGETPYVSSETRSQADVGPRTAGAGATSPRLGLALLVIATAQLMVLLDATIVNVALPHIQRALGFSGSGLEWVVNAYALTFGGLMLLGGRAGDLLGRRNVFIAELLVFSAASLAGGFATSQSWLLAARAVQGAGAAGTRRRYGPPDGTHSASPGRHDDASPGTDDGPWRSPAGAAERSTLAVQRSSAQPSPEGPLAGRSAGLAPPANRRGQWACMRCRAAGFGPPRGTLDSLIPGRMQGHSGAEVVPDELRERAVKMVLGLAEVHAGGDRVFADRPARVVSHCCRSSGLCGSRSVCRSRPRKTGTGPHWRQSMCQAAGSMGAWCGAAARRSTDIAPALPGLPELARSRSVLSCDWWPSSPLGRRGGPAPRSRRISRVSRWPVHRAVVQKVLSLSPVRGTGNFRAKTQFDWATLITGAVAAALARVGAPVRWCIRCGWAASPTGC